MWHALLVLFLFLCVPSLATGSSKPLPSVYIQMDFKLPWSELCLLETYVKTKLSEMLIQDNGTTVMVSQIYFNNFDENCQNRGRNMEEASLLFYVLKPGGNYEVVDEEMTKEAFRILHYLVENNLERLLAPLFESKIKKVQAKGWNAPPSPSGFSELERTYIAIAISFGVVATILLLAVVVYCCKESKKKAKGGPPASKTRAGHSNEGLEIIEAPPLKVHLSDEEPPAGLTETKF